MLLGLRVTQGPSVDNLSRVFTRRTQYRPTYIRTLLLQLCLWDILDSAEKPPVYHLEVIGEQRTLLTRFSIEGLGLPRGRSHGWGICRVL